MIKASRLLRPERERGSVTVEAAVALASLMVVLAICLAGIAAMVAQIRVTDAAGIAARLAARGDDAGAQAAVVALAPAGASLELSGSARITARVAAPPMAAILPGVRVSAQAVAAAEPPMVVP